MTDRAATFRLDLGDNGVVTLQGDEVFQWIDAERGAWAFVAGPEPTLAQRYHEALSLLQWAVPREGASRAQEFQEAYRQLVHHQSLKGIFVLSLRKHGDETAAAALAHFSGTNVTDPTNTRVLQGVALAVAYEQGWGDARPAVTAGFESLHHDIRAWWEQARSDIQAGSLMVGQLRKDVAEQQERLAGALDAMRAEADGVVAKLNAESQAALASATSGFNTAVGTYNKSMSDLVEGSREQMASIERSYEDKLALAAPVTYWGSRRGIHLKLAGVFGAVFLLALGLGGWALYEALGLLMPEPVSADRIPIGKIAESLVIVTFTLWMLRTLARIFFSNLHLGIDAGQRAIMVQTYLSLLRDSAGLTEDGKKLMIEALFRPASTGIVKDDASPPWAWTALFRKGE